MRKAGQLSSALLMVGMVSSAAVAQASRARMFVLPYFGSAPETGVQYGGTVFRVGRSDSLTRPSTSQLFASYTAKRQARIFAELDRWSTGNRYHALAHVEWQRFPLAYYGTGDSTPSSAEELYTPRGFLASAALQRRLRGPLYAMAGYRFQNLTIVETSDTGVLRSGAVTGSAGGRVAQLQGGGIWDTRDDVFAPERGSYSQVTGSIAGTALGSEYQFRRVVVDGRRYIGLGHRRVLALQGVVEATGGDAPFDQLSLVGGSNYLRGYAKGRYRDRDLAAAQAEFRSPIVGRLGGALFAGGGRIGPRAQDLLKGDARLLPSYGAGLRWQLFSGSRSTIRVDYALGASGNSGLYVALNEAF